MSRPQLRVVSAEIERDGAFLITQRRPQARMALYWEFPGGRVNGGESDQQALLRTLRERLGVDATVGEPTMHVTHEYEQYRIDLLVFRVTLHGEPHARKVHDLRWVFPEDFGDYLFAGADQLTADALLDD